ncbi:MAG TPA: Do family serine endopeptidase [bacterium]|nr:Do family serine endopeptidase [bacterium]
MNGKIKGGRCVMMLVLLAAMILSAPSWAGPNFWTDAPARENISLPSFAPLAEKAMPAVVTVYTKKEGKAYNFFFGMMPFVQEGAGSGFIISPDGYILTNNHVVADATSFKVVVYGKDERKEYDARLVGKDPDIDVALIKIDAAGLPSLPLGDSDDLRVGDWVAAIGSPFNFSQTFTVGVVSAKGRRLGLGNYDDFIQTDASINAGNSGGPLINLRGDVAGINTLIVSPSGGNVGIGFSTPINLVKMVLPQLKESGKVTRSWLGVSVEPVSTELAKARGLDGPFGAHVVEIVIGGPADEAGIQVDDIITDFDGRKIKDSGDLPKLVSTYGVSNRANVTWLHKGKEITKDIVLGKLPELDERKNLKSRGGVSADNVLGIGARDLNDNDRQALAIPNIQGVLVVKVNGGSPAQQNGIEEGDVVVKINNTAISNIADFNRALDKLHPGSYVRISVQRERISITRTFKLQ